ncbi:MAG: PE family protein, partial [Proteobacteria bacterium]|nr:PE family protein [Pseudomonadota bacterium]
MRRIPRAVRRHRGGARRRGWPWPGGGRRRGTHRSSSRSRGPGRRRPSGACAARRGAQ